MGRPTKYSLEKAKKICQALRGGSTRRAACGVNGITAETLQNWLKGNLAFSALVEEAESQAEINFTSTVATAAKEGDWKAAVEWLKRRRRDEWGDNIAVTADREAEAIIAALLSEETQ
jgi:hypothetical protein